MKIESGKQEFTPVTLTIETQEELDYFTTVFENVGGKATVKIFQCTSTIPNKFRGLGGVGDNFDCVINGGLWIEEK